MTITKYVSDWFARAEDDLVTARLLLKENTSPNQVCFHGQQAAEKYLKGFLAYHDNHIRKIHDLELILKHCQTIHSSFESLDSDAQFLTQFYIESRYPDDFIEFGREDAKKALEAALNIKEFVLSKTRSEHE